ncbi:hypothetical protein CIB84_001978 [Bambusicola thoracicus]|uniref:Uncharacterized protein n=1 Tax=Bambusicola thoracicus TaxID=9083 RepID=A0A2P4TD53_BAMTH|nr:hypothetical protein CIB84_001978 [Bambusicola thoracicus]
MFPDVWLRGSTPKNKLEKNFNKCLFQNAMMMAHIVRFSATVILDTAGVSLPMVVQSAVLLWPTKLLGAQVSDSVMHLLCFII